MELLPKLFDALRGGKVLRHVIHRFLLLTSSLLLHSQREPIRDSEGIGTGRIDPAQVRLVHLHAADRVLLLTSPSLKHPPGIVLALQVGAASDASHEGVTVGERGDEVTAGNKVRTDRVEEGANPGLP